MTDNDFLLKVLRGGDWISQDEILRRSQSERGYGMTVHSRAADLRKKGHMIVNVVRRGPSGRAQSFYRLVA